MKVSTVKLGYKEQILKANYTNLPVLTYKNVQSRAVRYN